MSSGVFIIFSGENEFKVLDFHTGTLESAWDRANEIVRKDSYIEHYDVVGPYKSIEDAKLAISEGRTEY